MAFNANETPKQNYVQQDPIPEGLYPARLARIIELGDQEDRYGVKTRVAFGFTIPSEKIDIKGEEKQRMIWSFPLNKTANPDATLVKWMKGLGGVTWEEVINQPCMIEVSHKTKDNITRDNLTNVVKPMNGLQVEEPDCDVYIFDFENPDKETWDKLSDNRQKQIMSALNYQGSAVEKMLDGGDTSEQTDTDGSDDSPI